MQLPSVMKRKKRFENEMNRLSRPKTERWATASEAKAEMRQSRLGETGLHSTAQLASTSLLQQQPQTPQLQQQQQLAATAAISQPSIASILPPTHAGPFPLEPTPLDVSAADRELLASQFAEAGEALYCIATVHKVGERSKRSERTLAVGEHRLIVLKPKKKGLLGGGNERSRQRVIFWHELFSCAGSADRNGMLRICFIPQQGRSSALPSLFLAKLAKISGYTAESMWQLLLEFKSPAVENTLLYCMRRAFEGVWRALGTLDDDRAPQLAAPRGSYSSRARYGRLLCATRRQQRVRRRAAVEATASMAAAAAFRAAARIMAAPSAAAAL